MKKISAIRLLTVLTMLCASVAIYSQRPRKTPKPLATPPILTGAEIISQAGDFTDDTANVVVPEQKKPEKAPSTTSGKIKDLNERVTKLESGKSDYEEKQKRMLLNLDILTKAEQRSDGLRKQVFEMTEKENTIKLRIDQIDYDSRPEVVERTVQIAGSLRPEEVRDARRKSLLAEKANLQSLLLQIQTNRGFLEANLLKSDAMVEKLRAKLEKDIDDSFLKDDEPEQ